MIVNNVLQGFEVSETARNCYLQEFGEVPALHISLP